jgi:hypothetical protein
MTGSHLILRAGPDVSAGRLADEKMITAISRKSGRSA